MNRVDLQKLASLRLKEAKHLQEAGLSDGAYYLAGYAVECSLKACIAKQTQAGDFPDKTKVFDSYKHELTPLLKVAGLFQKHASETSNDPIFRTNWTVVKDWSEQSRYESRGTMASDLLDAISDPQHGVMRWLQQHW